MGKMNENYLITMNYPLWTTIGEPFYNDADLVIPVKRKDISFCIFKYYSNIIQHLF